MQKTILLKLKRELSQKSTAQLSTLLGYRSATTVSNWVKAGRIPNKGVVKLKEYFTRKSKENVL